MSRVAFRRAALPRLTGKAKWAIRTQTRDPILRGVPLNAIADGKILLGHVGDEAVLLTKSGGGIFAVGATCTHYNGPLAEGIIVGDGRCPCIMPVSACAPVKPCAPRRSIPFRPGGSWSATATSMSPKNLPHPSAGIERAGPTILRTHHRWRRGRQCGGGNAAPERLRGPHHLIERGMARIPAQYRRITSPNRRRNPPFRCAPPNSQKQHGIDLVLNVCVAAIDPAAKTVRRQKARFILMTGYCWRRAPIRYSSTFPARSASTALSAHARRQPGRSSQRRKRPSAPSSSARASSVSRQRRRYASAGSKCMSSDPSRVRSKRSRTEIGDFVRALHESHGVIFHLGTSATAITNAGVTLAAARLCRPISSSPESACGPPSGSLRSGTQDRTRHRRRRIRNQRTGYFRGRRSRALAGPFKRAEHPRRALGRRGAAGPSRGTQHPRPPPPLRTGAILLEPALRRLHPLRRPCGTWDRTKIEGDLAAKSCQASYFSDGRKLAVAT